MQTVAEVMTRNVQSVSPQETLQRAAQLMDELNVGALPVVNGEQLVGMVTDRDITIRGIAAGRLPHEAHIDEVMSSNVRWCFEDQPLDEVLIQMADSQVRRIPVVSHDDQHRLIGIVSLGDVVTKTEDAQKHDVEEVVEIVSSPTNNGAGVAAQVDDVVGRTGEGGGGAAGDTADGSGTAGSERTEMAGGDVAVAAAIGGVDTAGAGMAGAGGDDIAGAGIDADMAGVDGDTGLLGAHMAGADHGGGAGESAGVVGTDDDTGLGSADTAAAGADGNIAMPAGDDEMAAAPVDAVTIGIDADADIGGSGALTGVDGGDMAGTDDGAGAGGADQPKAGEGGTGAVGASGEPTDGSQGGEAPGSPTADPRANSGVSGQDISAGGLPPA